MKIITPEGFIIEGTYDEVMKAYRELNPNNIQINLPDGYPWPKEPEFSLETTVAYGQHN